MEEREGDVGSRLILLSFFKESFKCYRSLMMAFNHNGATLMRSSFQQNINEI